MTKTNRRNWRRLLAGALIAIVVLVLLITAIILLTGSPESGSARTTTTASSITLEEWLGGWLSAKSFNGTWLSVDYFKRSRASKQTFQNFEVCKTFHIVFDTNGSLKPSLERDDNEERLGEVCHPNRRRSWTNKAESEADIGGMRTTQQFSS
ncbi:hypothetical protein KQX54_008145 [Cotesia glomerata]|uniref:Uncharacterized protein n=1 Tax=Cotesia glomerata TaxID=32391 RepID=A0AAV7ILM3_COTGL|nr:hypothetical protein KQX54_008145 [Cotesia glomerata]